MVASIWIYTRGCQIIMEGSSDHEVNHKVRLQMRGNSVRLRFSTLSAADRDEKSFLLHLTLLNCNLAWKYYHDNTDNAPRRPRAAIDTVSYLNPLQKVLNR
jgi:hypothetical protein